MKNDKNINSLKPNILLIDDMEINLLLLKAILVDCNCFILTASSGEEGLNLLDNIEVACILLDVVMPDMDGFEVVKKIKANPRTANIPIILVTAIEVGREKLALGYDVGALDYLIKPLNPNLVRAKVSLYCELYINNALLRLREKKQKQSLLELNLIYESTKIVEESTELTNTLKKIITLVCEVIAWPIGHVYLLDKDEDFMVSSGIWSGSNLKKVKRFRAKIEKMKVEHGIGLAGQIWESMTSIWVEDLALIDGFPDAQQFNCVSLHGAVGFPILAYGKVIAICEFFSYVSEEKNESILRVLQLLGEQIGRRFEQNDLALKLDKLAHFDIITGLPNRAYFYETLLRSIHNSHRTKKEFGLLYLDLDNFKKINDSLGHQVGDQLLKYVTNVIKESTRSSDFFARIGGDEFAIMVEGDGASLHESVQLAQRIISVFQTPCYIEKYEINSSVSIGITQYPAGGTDVSSLMKNADLAMYRAKELGKNTYQFFSDKLNKEYRRQILIESHLRHAIEKNEFFLVYQPQISLLTGKIYGFEVLLRWNSPTLEQIGPAEFIPIAENIGLISEIGAWVIKQACHQVQSWLSQYPWFKQLPLVLSVNVSVLQLIGDDFVSMLSTLMNNLQFKPADLILEVTETAIMTRLESSLEVLKAFNHLGVGLAIDDFGTGYSSLNYLKKIPFTALKIDQSFVRDLLTDANSASIVKAIIQLGMSLELDIIAEGIENRDQLDYLKQVGCHYGQGYHISYPLLPVDLIQFIKKNTVDHKKDFI